jgi:D-glycero-D-manno-heptose 1,7-bisphosphate phosphatase
MRAIFLDRDGVICENRSDHVKSWQEFEFLPGAKKSLAALLLLLQTRLSLIEDWLQLA